MEMESAVMLPWILAVAVKVRCPLMRRLPKTWPEMEARIKERSDLTVAVLPMVISSH